MNECEMIHETIIRDVIDMVEDIKNSDMVKGVFNTKNVSSSSIAKASSNLTLVFPVIVSKTANIDNSSMVCKAIERNAVAMLQMLFSALQLNDSPSLFDYLKKFHTNLDFKDGLNVDEFIYALDNYATKNESVITNADMYNAVMEDLKNLSYRLDPEPSKYSINDYEIKRNPYTGVLESTLNEAKRSQADDYNRRKLAIDRQRIKMDAEKLRMAKSQDAIKNDMDRDKMAMAAMRDMDDTARNANGINKTASETFKNQLLDTDAKKANELVPSMMIVNFVSMAQGHPIVSNCVIGVKAKMYVADSEDIITHMILKNKDKNGLFNIIRATTREISFWKDFVFALDRAKLDAISSSGRGSSSKIWKLLERRAIKSKMKRFTGAMNDASEIGRAHV